MTLRKSLKASDLKIAQSVAQQAQNLAELKAQQAQAAQASAQTTAQAAQASQYLASQKVADAKIARDAERAALAAM